jgi:Cof subfamily protein (haloacid dehalogenase superfamily)
MYYKIKYLYFQEKNKNFEKRVESLMYRIVFLDIDGTILNSQGTMDSNLVQLLKKLKQKGVLVGFATGRSYIGAKSYGDRVGCGIYVTYNGSYVLNQSNIVSDIRIPASLAFELCSHTLKENGIYVHFSANTSISNQPQKQIEYLLPKASFSEIWETKKRAHRLTLYIKFAKRKIIQRDLSGVICFDEGDRLEIYPESSKWEGIIKIINILGIATEEVVTIGDGFNDMEMIRNAGLAIAMGNAPSLVKQYADCITENNDHNGVQIALKKVFSTL